MNYHFSLHKLNLFRVDGIPSALNAYMIFSQQNRDRVKQDNPEAKMGDISKLLGEAYKKLSPEVKAELDKKVCVVHVYS